MADKEVAVKIITEIDDDEVKALEEELEAIENESPKVPVNVDDEELDATKEEIEELDGTDIDVSIDNIAAMESINQISEGFDRLKQGAGEIGQQMGVILEASGKQEMNKTFLEMNLGAEKAADSMQTISDIVNEMPGDDTALQGLLSQAMVKNAGMTKQELQGMATAATDYFSAMSFYGKSASEAQQDMTNYILSGNTAELERSPILQEHIDKLKQGTTVQERSKLLQEALNEAGWGGISTQDTYNNKLETFNGMLERGKYNLGGMFQEGAVQAMDFVMQLDDASGGMVGMGIALAGFASPLTDSLMGLGQMATGMKAIKDLGMIQYLKDLEIMTKLSAAGEWLLSAAQWALDAAMDANPIVIIVLALIALAAALVWAYYNVDWFREMVDNAWASLVEFAQTIYTSVMGAIQWLSEAFTNFTSQIGNDIGSWIMAILNFLTILPTLPLQLAITLANALASVLGFGNNFVQNMINTAIRTVTGFITYISQLPGRLWNYLNNMISRAVSFASGFVSRMYTAGSNSVTRFIGQITSLPGKLQTELNNMLSAVGRWAATLPQKFWDAGVNAVKNFLSALGIASPGTMQRMLVWEVNEMGRRVPMESRDLLTNMSRLGSDIVDEFGNPTLGVDFETANASFTGGADGLFGGQIINLNVEVGTVDSNDRVQEVVDAIRRELAWNNTTAGRSV